MTREEVRTGKNKTSGFINYLIMRNFLVMIRRLLEVARDCTGAAMLEFALVLPVLLLVVFGITQFGLIFYHYSLVTNAAEAGTRTLSISFQDPHPYCDTVNAIIDHTSGGLGGTPGTSHELHKHRRPHDYPRRFRIDNSPPAINLQPCASDAACIPLLINAHN